MNHHVLNHAATIVLRLGILAFCLLPLRGTAAQTVTLAWDRNAETNVVGYKLYYGLASRSYPTGLNVGNVLTASVSNLLEGTTYYFALTALNSAGLESDFSAEIPYTIPGAVSNSPPTLNPISNLTINEDSGAQTVQLSGISSGALNEIQTLTVTVSSSNPGLIPNPSVTYTSPNSTGVLNFTGVTNASGSATITVTVSDGQAQTNRSFVVTVNPVNDPPTLATLAPRTISEDATMQSVSLSGITSGAPNEAQPLSVTATCNNPGLIPNPTVTYTSPNSSGMLRFTPASNAVGSAAITVTVSDGQAQTNRSFMVTVDPVNDPPTLASIAAQSISEDAAIQTVPLSGITSGATDEVQTLSVTATSSDPALIPNPTVNYISPNSTGSLSFTPVSNASGSATITVTVSDGQVQTNRTFIVTVNPVNDPPALATIADQTLSEDAATQTVQLSGISSGATNEAQTLSVTATSSNPALIPNPTVNYISPNSTGSLSFTPVSNASGSATISVTVSDGQAQTNRSFVVTVNPINDPPTLATIADQVISEGAATQTVQLSGITSGATDEAQTLSVTGTSSNPTLIPNPTVTYTSPNSTGSLSFTPISNVSGSATVTVTVSDGQAQTNRSFVVTVNAASNSPPTLSSIADQTIDEDAAMQTVQLSGISSGAPNEAQTLSVTATSSNPALIPNPTVNYISPNSTGSLSFTPVSNASGSATISVTVSDGQAQTNRSFVVTVNPVNDPPVLASIGDQTISEDVAMQTVQLSGINSGATNEAQTLSVTATSSNPALIPNPTVTYTSPNTTGSLSFTLVSNASGLTTITATVSDGQAQTNRSFTITVNAVNDLPTLASIADQVLSEGAATQTVQLSGITSGATNELQTLSVTATSSNPALIPNPTVTYTSPNSTGSLSFTPVSNVSGSATISVAVNDGQAQTNRSFVVTVNAATNNAPTLSSIADQTIDEDAAAQTVQLSGISSGATNEAQTLSITATSSNPALISNPTVTYTSPNTTGSLSFTPVSNASGSATISVTVSDGQAQTNRSFVVTVNPVNDPPTLASIADRTIDEDASTQTVQLSGISSGATNETQTLSVTATSSNPALIPNPTVTYASPNSTGSLSFKSVTNASGLATITVTVSDGQAQTDRSFVVTVNPVNDLPIISAIPAQTVDTNTPTAVLPFTIGDAETAASNLIVSAVSSNLTLVPATNIVLGGSDSNRTVRVTPATDQFGSSTIRIFVSDGTSSNSTSFLLTVVGVNSAPAISPIPDQRLATAKSCAPIPFTINDRETSPDVLVLSARSSDPRLIPVSGIQLGGSSSNRTVTITPGGRTGSAIVTINVSDGLLSATNSFKVTVAKPPKVRSLSSPGNGSFTIDWESDPGETYRVLYTTNLNQPNWIVLSENITATGPTTSWTDVTIGSDPSRFYTIEILPP